MIRLFTCLFLFWAGAVSAAAHEIRPAYLEIIEVSDLHFEVRWKQPIADGRRLALDPVLPETCTPKTDPDLRLVNGAVVSRWNVACSMRAGTVSIAGLERTLTDVFVEVKYLDGDIRSAVLRPGEDGIDLSEATGHATIAYFQLGVEHILSGPDHLLFVAGLILLARLRQLVFVITAFTLAHSLTLGLTSVGWVNLSPAPVETLIAVSILLLAVEALRVMDGQTSLAARWPWLVSFGFGLLHGFGFAGALGEIGLPQGSELAALFYFNIGVEVGQLLFIAGCLSLAFVLLKTAARQLSAVRRSMAYIVGISGAFWVFERLGSIFI